MLRQVKKILHSIISIKRRIKKKTRNSYSLGVYLLPLVLQRLKNFLTTEQQTHFLIFMVKFYQHIFHLVINKKKINN